MFEFKSTLPCLPKGKQAKEPCEKTILKIQASSLNPFLCRKRYYQMLEQEVAIKLSYNENHLLLIKSSRRRWLII